VTIVHVPIIVLVLISYHKNDVLVCYFFIALVLSMSQVKLSKGAIVTVAGCNRLDGP
jgi:hypothetical protein